MAFIVRRFQKRHRVRAMSNKQIAIQQHSLPSVFMPMFSQPLRFACAINPGFGSAFDARRCFD